MIAAHPERASIALVAKFLAGLTSFVKDFNSEESRRSRNVPFIEKTWGYRKEDIEVCHKTLDKFAYIAHNFAIGLAFDREIPFRLYRNSFQSDNRHLEVCLFFGIY